MTVRFPHTAGHTEFRARRFFGCLDGLRAASILAVIWHHAQTGIPALPGSERGFLGVDMFFVISGFLIVTLLLRERDRAGSISLGRFYARRTLRIFPAYYAILLALAVLYVFRDSPRSSLFWAELPYYLTYTSNWIPAAIFPLAWSLAAEEQFYLCWPPIERGVRRAAVPLVLLFIGLNQLVSFGIGIGAPDAWLGSRYPELAILQATFTPICLGVLLAHALHDARGFRLLHRVLAARVSAPLMALALLVVCNLPNEDIRGLHRLAIQLLMSGVVGACVIVEANGLQRVLTLGAVSRIGVVSYGMYLYHIFVIDLVHRLGVPSLLVFVSAGAGTWVVAELSFRGFESRFLAWKTRFAVTAAETDSRSSAVAS